jgi:hypothetical protein
LTGTEHEKLLEEFEKRYAEEEMEGYELDIVNMDEEERKA